MTRFGPNEAGNGEDVPEAVACVLWSVPSRGGQTRERPQAPCDRRNTLHAARLFTSLRCLPCAFPVQLRHPPGLNITVVPDPPNSDRYAAYLVLKLVEGN